MLKITIKGEWIFILKTKIKFYTKETVKIGTIIILGFIIILASIFFKYKPVYAVTIAGEELGIVQNKDDFNNKIESEVLNSDEENIADISLDENIEYQFKLYSRKINTSENNIIQTLKDDYTTKIYKFYEVAVNNETKEYVETIEEAEEIVNKINEEYNTEEIEVNIQINEKYTVNKSEINPDSLEVATNIVESAVKEIKDENESLAIINGVKVSVLPVSGMISSRYGESSSRRSSTHTGLDIACSTGTSIRVIADGTVTFAANNGAYGNLIKVDHGNGVETWYAHCSKINAKVGQKVTAGDIIAAVGSTGNSTGPHLHLEIRIDGNTVNPQKYVY